MRDDLIIGATCECPVAGYCSRYKRHVLGKSHDVCQGRTGTLEHRAGVLGYWLDAAIRAGRIAGPEADPGGLGLGHHVDDHYALSFTRAGRMSLHDARGETDDSLRDKWPGTWYYLGGGPSLLDVPLFALEGKQTLAVNSVAELFPRPTVWLGVDPPDEPADRYRGVPWEDPAVVKLLPRGLAGCAVGEGLVYEQPNTRFFLRNTRFDAGAFLSERTVNWGSEAPWGSGRSVMLAALKLLWYLGASRVVLLGVDWHMDPARPYAHSATKDAKGCESNNAKFGILEERFRRLNPVLERAGMTVVNATQGSRLDVFPRTTLAYELANEGLFGERRAQAIEPAVMASRADAGRQIVAENRRWREAAKACPHRSCHSCSGEAGCAVGLGNLREGSGATLQHCAGCVASGANLI